MRSEKRTTRSASLSNCLVRLEPGWPVNHLVPWAIGTFGYCMECGAKIDSQRLKPLVSLLCLDCEDARVRWILFSAVHDC